MANANVEVVSNHVSKSQTTASNGAYTLEGLPAGDYTVCFVPPTPSATQLELHPQCWDNKRVGDTPTTVAVTIGSTTTGVDASLKTYGAIKGTVTDAASFGGLGDVSVTASLESDPSRQFFALTANDGTYTIQGLESGNYDVCFYPAIDDSTHIGQCYDGKPLDGWTAADAVTVAAGVSSTGINASFVRAGSITGTVSSGNAPLAGVDVQAVSLSGSGAQQDATTASDGSYALDGLSAGDYTVCFYPADPGSLPQCYNGQDPITGTPDSVPVASGATTSAINADLGSAGSIAGTISTSDGPLAEATVEILNVDDGVTTYATTDSNGAFAAGSLSASTYEICAYPAALRPTVYLPGCYENTATGDQITISEGQSAAGIDITLTKVKDIVGTVTSAATGQPLAGIEVDAFPLENTGTNLAVTTASDGTYALPGLMDGGYLVCFYPDAGYLAQCYFDQAADGTGSPVPISLSAGVGAVGVDANLQPEN